ncbi:MAG: GTP-binding protein [Candidatus Hodarchaeota archaeon]
MSAPGTTPHMFMFKLPLLGEPAVGKTTLVRAFMGGRISDRYSPTLGVEIGRKKVIFDLEDQPVEVHFQLWDLAGQVSFKTIRSSYYKGASGLVLVYDIGRYATFMACEKWLAEAWNELGHLPMVLVGNKLDLRLQGKAEVTTEEGKEYAQSIEEGINLPTPFIEASAIRARNADKPFIELAKVIMLKQREQAE